MHDSHKITEAVIGASMKVHRTLGPGFLESVYRNALAFELRKLGFAVEMEWPLKVFYERTIVGEFSADLLVERSIIVELKALQNLIPAHEVQTVNYLTATNLEVGLLINFGAPSLQFKRKHRQHRLNPVNPVNPVQNSAPSVHPRLFDISRVLHRGAPHWPGDTATDFALTARIADGAACNVGRLTLSVHNGTHVDAPYHYNEHGATVDALDLDRFMGPARVIDARGHATLTASLCGDPTDADFTATPRLLFRTDAWLDPTRFPATWPLLDPALPAWLAARGVTLIGLDVPSVDGLDSKDLPLHHALEAADILILESLDLGSVDAGVYDLIALPLKLRGADGSPVRAVLRSR